MSVRSGVAAVAVLVLALACSPSRKTETNIAAESYPRELTSAPGKDIAERRCLACHSASLLTQQHKDSTAWAKTIAQMEAWSASLPTGERDSLLQYLVASQGWH